MVQYLTEHHKEELEHILADLSEHSIGYDSVTWSCGFGSITMTLGKAKELLKPSLPSDVDEAAEEYEHIEGHFYYPSIKDAFKAGAEWQKEQPKVNLLKRDTEDIFAREYAIYSLPPFVVESIAYGTQLIDFIYKTAHHFYGRGFRRAAEMYDEIEYNRQKEED